MYLKTITSFIFLLTLLIVGCSEQKPYEDTSLTFNERVDDLVGRMTLKEKISQLKYDSPAIAHLNIPSYNWWNECLHGVGRAGIATVFPQAIGMAAMWDSDAMYNIANVVSDEARAKHHMFLKENKRGIYQGLTFWTPNINIFRDPRWGRGMETYGEDPFLSGQLGVSYIKGLQGNDSIYLKLVATAKHFAVHSGPESNRHSFNVKPSKYDFIETYSPQFKKAVEEGHVYSIMCAYNRLDGEPCCGNRQLSDLLRNQWGFQGYIVSDCWAVNDFYRQNAHEVVNTKAEAAAMAVQAGTDLNCGNSYPALEEAIESGYITENEIDVSVKRLMLARMKLGMFDPEEKVPFASIPIDVVDSERHRLLALEAARKSMVLLKNENNLLPLNKNLKTLAVIGPNANHIEALLGNYNGYPSSPVTPLAGLINKLPDTKVSYALGCRHADELPYLSAVPKDFLFTDSTCSVNGLMGAYFNNSNWEGQPDLTRLDKTIDFEWWNNGPGEPINANEFSAQWTGFFMPAQSGEYALGGEGLTEFSVWLDDELMCSHSSEHHPIQKYFKLKLDGGQKYKLKVTYRQFHSEYALARLMWEPPLKNLKDQAIAIAKEADAVILCMGLSPLLEGEEMDILVEGFDRGDRVNIELPKVQQQLIKDIIKIGRPTVLVLMNGSALAINWEKQNVPAILEAWYPGQSGGTAIADVLFGDYNPAGRLPVTFYKSVDQLPDFENYNMDGRTYRYFNDEPLFEFGYGLSYTQFEYSNLITPESIIAGEPLYISVDVTNKGKMDGEEVVQLYVSHPKSKYKVAIRSLKGFQRIYLKAGETQTVSFQLNPDDMAVLDEQFQYVLTGQAVELSVGGGQPNNVAMDKRQVMIGHVIVQLVNDEVFVLK